MAMIGTATENKSIVRLLYQDPRGSVIPPLWEGHTSLCGAQTDDMTKMQIMPFINLPIFKEDDKLVVQLLMDTAAAVAKQPSYCLIPVTIRNVRTGVVSRTHFSTTSFTEYETQRSFSTSEYRNFMYRTVPAGEKWKLGHKYAFNSRIMVATYDCV